MTTDDPGDLIEIDVEGVIVRGRIVYRDERDIDVELVHELGAVVDGSHLPAFDFRTFDGDFGEETARQILREIYEIITFVDGNIVELRETWLAHVGIETTTISEDAVEVYWSRYLPQFTISVELRRQVIAKIAGRSFEDDDG